MSGADDSLFRSDGAEFHAGEDARGPWDPEALHGGAPAALIARAFERCDPRGGMRIARMSFELLRPIPFGPLTLHARMVRDGRRVQELAAELRAGEQQICRASALRVAEVPEGLPETPAQGRREEPMPGPEHASPVHFGLDGSDGRSFAAAMEMRALEDPHELGPARVWMRLGPALLDGEPASPLARLVATADFGNGISASLPFARFLFINADLAIHLHRPPRGEWIGLDARTLLDAGGSGLAECVVHDLDGPVGRSFQTLVVAPR
ncbi:MAG TPA: thioesterase family protein [Solirubrobacteraceae bacterium]|nr:thioesterase family protein [Solirubrobacteraceae bacterium]